MRDVISSTLLVCSAVLDIHCSGSFSYHEFYSFIFVQDFHSGGLCKWLAPQEHRNTPQRPRRNMSNQLRQIERTEYSEVCFGVPGFTTCLDKPLQGAKLGFFKGGGWGGGGTQ